MNERPRIHEYIDGLDLVQLNFLVEKAQERIAAKRQAGMAKLYEVLEDDLLVIGRYRMDDFESARNRLIRAAMQAKPGFLRLSIGIGHCPADEVDEWLTGDM